MNPEADLVGFSKKEGALDEIKLNIKEEIDKYNSRIKEKIKNENSIANQANRSKAELKSITETIKKKEYSKAIQLCNIFLANSKDFQVFYLRGYAYYCTGYYSKSITDFTSCINIQPESNLYYFRARAKIKMEDYSGTIEDFDRIIELNKAPDNYDLISILNDKAYSLLRLNNLNEALKTVNKALEADKNKWYIWDTRGEIYFKLGYYKKCIQDMTAAILLNPDSNSYLYRALSQIKLGDKKNACKDLSKSWELGNIKAFNEIEINCK
jgi:tetratricopeptide (TPR) repeat protein